MATKLKPVDAVVVGVGLSGSILAKELAEAGLHVVGLERGRWRDTDPDFAMPHAHDELRYVKRHELMQDLSRETISFRNNTKETALPMRQLGSFRPGEGVGGAAVHWGGLTWRFLPWDFETRSRTLARYGKEQMAADCTSQDWGVTYDELEPHFDRFEHLYGISGKAGNLKGKIIPGGNPFEGPRPREYPNPPLKLSNAGSLFEQPAELILLTSYVFNNVRLMLLSGIGKPYDPVANTGVVGRNYAYQTPSSCTLFFEDKVFNQFMAAGGMGVTIDEFNGDNFDHAGLGFIGGGFFQAATSGSRPIEVRPVPRGPPRWGSEWRHAVAKYFNRSFAIAIQGACQSYRSNYLDLDPAYRDAYGLPLLRMTFDRHENEHKMSVWITTKAAEIGKAIGPSKMTVSPRTERYTIVPYQSTHNTGGAAMGAEPATSAVNKYLQSWDVPNVFVVGASAFPQNGGYNPTGTVGALTFHALQAIKTRYLKRPGPLA